VRARSRAAARVSVWRSIRASLLAARALTSPRSLPLPLSPYTTLFRSIVAEIVQMTQPFFAGMDLAKKDTPFLIKYPEALIFTPRSEEHTSELQSRFDLVCRLLLEKKKIHEAPRRGTECP